MLEDETIYKGQIKNNRINDKNGTIIFPDGSYYKGEIKRGIIEGHGVYIFADQTYSYEGQWVKGLPEGEGLEISPCGTYQDSFLKGKKWGKGRLKFEDDSLFIGSFEDNLINGYGTYQTKKSIAKGNWVDGFLEGAGVQKYPDGA